MLNLAFKEKENYENLIFHSDQGWQYQHYSYPKKHSINPLSKLFPFLDIL